MIRNFRIYLLASSLFLLPRLLPAGENDWPRYRGPNGSGVSRSGEIPTKWEKNHFKWQSKIPGKGYGSPVIWGNRIFLLSAISEGKSETPAKKKKGKRSRGGASFHWLAICLNKTNGETLWTKKFDPASFKGHRFNSPASSTAAVDSKRVIFTWGTPKSHIMLALSHEGEELWITDLGPVVGGHGYAASPVLYGDLVILNNDQEKQNGNLLALNANTGDRVWTTKRHSERISYSVPCIYPNGEGDRLIFTNWQHGFTALDPKTGKVIAEKSVFDTDTNERAISSPVMAGADLVIGTCGFTANPKHCVAMRLKGNSFTEVWRIERNVPHIPSLIVVGDLAFLIDDSGIGTCVETSNGKTVWKERIPKVEGKVFGSPVSDGKNLFFADESGVVHVIKISRQFQYQAANPLEEACKTTPALSEGVLFIRTETMLHAVSKQG